MEPDVDNLVQAFDRILKAIYEERLGWMDALLRDAMHPESFFNYVASLGLDMSGITSKVGQPDGFNPYRVLGLEKTASDQEVKARYRDLLRKLHPDTAGVQGTSFLLQMVYQAHKQIAKERGW